MKNTKERLVILGGCLLAWLCAGVNAGFLIKFGTSVSHLTGDISRVAMDAVRWDRDFASAALLLCYATAGFLIGAIFSGYYICHPKLEFSRPYGRSLIVIGLLLAVAHFALTSFVGLAVLLASAACGLQNAMATHFRGVILRTTHLTGLITDLGSNIGMRLKGHDIARWKIAIPVLLSLSFFAGALCGAALVLKRDLPFLLIYSAAYLVGGVAYVAAKRTIVAYARR